MPNSDPLPPNMSPGEIVDAVFGDTERVIDTINSRYRMPTLSTEQIARALLSAVINGRVVLAPEKRRGPASVKGHHTA